MRRKSKQRILATVLLAGMLSQNVMAGVKLPDVGKMASDAASGAARQVEDLTSGFSSQANAVISEWGQQAGETVEDIKKGLSDAGVEVQIAAAELGKATVEKASELTEKAGKTADDAINAVSDAGNMVIDQAGHVVDLAAAGAGYVSSAAGEAFHVFQEKGEKLMDLVREATADIDLSDERNWEKAELIVGNVIDKAYETGILKDEKPDRETLRIIKEVIFGTMIYTCQYADNEITLGEYAGAMSEMIIKEGLPCGVGLIVSLLPIRLPKAERIARNVTYYLICVAYGDKPGDKISEEEKQLLKEAIGQMEEETEAVTE